MKRFAFSLHRPDRAACDSGHEIFRGADNDLPMSHFDRRDPLAQHPPLKAARDRLDFREFRHRKKVRCQLSVASGPPSRSKVVWRGRWPARSLLRRAL